MRPRPDERGVIGFELLPFLILVFVIGTLVFAQAWVVLDAKLATNSAAREATRTFVEQPAGTPNGQAIGAALSAGHRAATGHETSRATAVTLVSGGRLERCARVTFEATQTIAMLTLPFVGGAGSMTVRSTHTEIVDPYRDGLDRAEVPCAG